MSSLARATLVNVEEGAAVSGGPQRTVRALFEHPLIDVTWSRYEPGQKGPDPHVHHRHVDAFYVVEGELRYGVGPEIESVPAPAGTFVLVRPNVIHTFENASDDTARWLNFHAPSTGFLAYLRGERESFDSYDAPADGGRSATDAIVASAATVEQLDRKYRTLAIVGHEPQLSVIELACEPGFEVAPHRHTESVDSFFVLEGEVEFMLGNRRIRGGAGTWMSAPPGAEHGFRIAGPGRARMLNVHAPDAGFAARL